MKRVLFAVVPLALALLAGCVVTPAYRYSGGNGGYYYSRPYQESTVIYGGASTWYPYAAYGYDAYGYAPWAYYPSTRVYVRDRDDYRDRGYHDRGHQDGRNRLATRFRQRVIQRHAPRRQPRHIAPARTRASHTSPRTRIPRETRRSWHRKSRATDHR
jgi:hypothetical protein